MRTLLLLGFIYASIQTSAYAVQASPAALPASTPSAVPSPSEVPSTSAAAHPVVAKRDWWLTLSRHDKLKVVEGAVDGYQNGWWSAFIDYNAKVIVAALGVEYKLNEKTKYPVSNKLGKVYETEKRLAPHWSHPYGFYVDAIDRFYQKHPHAANVTVGEILECLNDHPWMSCDEAAGWFR
jgi:hypothetical protein